MVGPARGSVKRSLAMALPRQYRTIAKAFGLDAATQGAANLLEEILVGGAAALIKLRVLKDWRFANVRHVCHGRGK